MSCEESRGGNDHVVIRMYAHTYMYITGSSPAEAALLFLLGKKELSSGVVACICLVSINDRTCTNAYSQSPPGTCSD